MNTLLKIILVLYISPIVYHICKEIQQGKKYIQEIEKRDPLSQKVPKKVVYLYQALFGTIKGIFMPLTFLSKSGLIKRYNHNGHRQYVTFGPDFVDIRYIVASKKDIVNYGYTWKPHKKTSWGEIRVGF